MWAQSEDILRFFEAFQVMYNPNAFTHKTIDLLHSNRENSFTHDENKEILVVEKTQQEEGEEKQEGEQLKSIKLLFGFGQQPSPCDSAQPYSLLQKFDFDAFRVTSEVVRLQSHISGQLLSLKNQNTVFRLYTASKGNYGYWVSADSPFKLLSIADYLTEFEGYSSKSVACEYPAIQGGSYFPLLRLKIQQEAGHNKLLFKLNGISPEVLPYLNLRVVTLDQGEQPLTQQLTEGVI